MRLLLLLWLPLLLLLLPRQQAAAALVSHRRCRLKLHLHGRRMLSEDRTRLSPAQHAAISQFLQSICRTRNSYLCGEATRIQDQHHPVSLSVGVEMVCDCEQQAGVGGKVNETVLQQVLGR